MAFPYHFPSNSPAQSSRRRQLLDAYGQFAQISTIMLPLFCFQISFIVRFLLKKLRLRQNKYGYSTLRPSSSRPPRQKVRQSPRVATFSSQQAGSDAVEEEEMKGKKLSGSIGRWWTRFRWALDGPVATGWGTWREWSIAASWTAWLMLLVIKDTGDDYLHLTRRFGIVAASQLPLHYLLALKSWSPIQYLTRLSHEELNPYHRLLGRILTFFFLAHGMLYLNFYVQLSILSKRLRSAVVLLGLCALATLLVLNSTALARVRTWSYRVFFGSHVILSIAMLPLLYFHVSHARMYVLEAAAIYMLLLLQRNLSSTPVVATISRIPGSPLLSIRIPLTPRLARRRYHPGQHVYLSLPATRTSPLNRIRHHPFTIATLPSPSASIEEIQLVIRPIRGTTQLLSSLAQQSHIPPKSRLLIEGPYGASRFFPDLLGTHDRIILVAGGVGATFTLPIYRHLLQQLQQRPKFRTNQTHGQKVHFVWSVRSIADASWGLQQLELEGTTDDDSNNSPNQLPHHQDPQLTSHPTKIHNSNCDIYISTANSSSHLAPSSPSSSSPPQDAIRTRIRTRTQNQDQDQDQALELQPRNLPPSPPTYSPRIHAGRPNLSAIIDEIFSEAEAEADTTHASFNADADAGADDNNNNNNSDSDAAETGPSNRRSGNNDDLIKSVEESMGSGIRVAVLVCGPTGMGTALRREVGRWVRRGGPGRWDVFWHDEEFGW